MKTETETIGETLQRLARESLPRHYDNACGEHNPRRYCMCGEPLPPYPKTRQKQLVCDDCAAVIPRLLGGRHPAHACTECGVTATRSKLKMKDRRLYCKKCFKLKFKIDF